MKARRDKAEGHDHHWVAGLGNDGCSAGAIKENRIEPVSLHYCMDAVLFGHRDVSCAVHFVAGAVGLDVHLI